MAVLKHKAGGYYPPVGFHFKVEFLGLGNDNDQRFQSVSGLTMSYETETFKEGGENRFTHTLPVRTQFTDLVLKRGMLTDSAVLDWCLDALENRKFKPVDLQVSLLNEAHEALRLWTISRAWPKKWTVSDFNAQENAIVVETLELSYQYFKIK